MPELLFSNLDKLSSSHPEIEFPDGHSLTKISGEGKGNCPIYFPPEEDFRKIASRSVKKPKSKNLDFREHSRYNQLKYLKKGDFQ
jgi:hypothetical protein